MSSYESTPIQPKQLTFWFQGCPECLGDQCSCPPKPDNSTLINRLALGKKYARMRRERRAAQLARARSFKKSSRVQRVLQIQKAYRTFLARRRVMQLRRDRVKVPKCGVCGSTEEVEPGDELGRLVHVQGCPDTCRTTLACHCGRIFCRQQWVCRGEAVAKFIAENFVNYK